MSLEIEVSDTQGHLLVETAALQHLAARVLIEEGRHEAAISIALVDDAAIHALNRTHLGHDWPTDVITFPLSEPHDPVLAGELVISAETAVRSAQALAADPQDELKLYLVHGLLHLCGYDDSDETAARAMRRREREILAGAAGHEPAADRAISG